MEQVDLVIHGGTIVLPRGRIAAAIAIKDGTIVAIGEDTAMPEARERLDATGLHILPGAIDDHVHFRDPGYTHKEDFESGTAAAAFGGVTTVFDMPNTVPTVSNAAVMGQKLAIASGKAYVDYGLYAVLGEDSLDHIDALVDAGAIGFKLYMGNTFGKIPTPSTGVMLEAFERVAPTGKRISLHAETNSVMVRRELQLRAAGRNEAIAHLASRPYVVDVEAVARAAALSEFTGARVHILHISSAAELVPLREAKARGVDITGETCPQYLLLSEHDYDRVGGVVRVNPPVREAYNQDPLWQGLRDGTIDVIATDHAPHTVAEKTRPVIWDVDCGFPGVETQRPMMITELASHGATLEDYVRWSSEQPAKIWGLYPRKGTIEVGSDADIAILDLDAPWVFDSEHSQSRAKISPWEGRRMTTQVLHTLVRGQFVMKNRLLQTQMRGTGRSVHRIQDMPAPDIRNPEATTRAILAGSAPLAHS